MTPNLQIPGFAILARVRFDTPQPEGDGFMSAWAVRATNADAAWERLSRHLAESCDGKLTREDCRILAPGEAPDHADLYPLGARVYFNDVEGL